MTKWKFYYNNDDKNIFIMLNMLNKVKAHNIILRINVFGRLLTIFKSNQKIKIQSSLYHVFLSITELFFVELF